MVVKVAVGAGSEQALVQVVEEEEEEDEEAVSRAAVAVAEVAFEPAVEAAAEWVRAWKEEEEVGSRLEQGQLGPVAARSLQAQQEQERHWCLSQGHSLVQYLSRSQTSWTRCLWLWNLE